MRSLYEIGPMRLDPEAGVLTHAGAPLALGARAIAVLATLVGQAQEYVSKAAILDAAWPGLVVEEANLAVQISAIRRVLARVPGGESWIETLARRGYRFVGPVVAIADPRAATAALDRTRTNLPQLLTSFVGRERELAEIKQRLPDTRMLTLTGTGGIGKTRLALQAAAEVREAYRDGAWFVDLSALVDPTLVASALAQVLKVKEAAGQPLQATLCAHLRGKEVLLIVDNCEQVLAAVADLAEALLGATAKVTLVATSREPLHVGGEQVYPVAALPVPGRSADAKGIARSDAVQLFVERARAHRPSFDLEGSRARAVADICVRLDGIPLALELAAARVAVLPVEQIERLLDQRFRLLTSGSGSDVPRHQTLRAMLDWSYDLLNDNERLLLARFSVFAGGFTLAAAEAVAIGDPIAKDDIVYLLIALVEQSLIVADEDGDRYRMLETVREYAREKLNASGSADTFRTQHRDYFLALAEEAAPKLRGAQQLEWLQRLDKEHENLRTSLDWGLRHAEPGPTLELCTSLQYFWTTRGYFSEGRGWCAGALRMPGTDQLPQEHARALNCAGVLAYHQSDQATARALLEECLAIERRLGDRSRVAIALGNLGMVIVDLHELAAARAYHEESLAIMRELGNEAGVAATLNNLAMVVQRQGDLSSARALLEEGLAIKRALDDPGRIATSLGNLGAVTLEQGDLAGARALYDECLTIMRELGNRQYTALALERLAGIALAQSDYSTAQRLGEESLAIGRELQRGQGIADSLCLLGNVTLEKGDASTARQMFEEGLAIQRQRGDQHGKIASLVGLAAVVAARGECLRAARLWGAVEQWRADNRTPLSNQERPRYDERVSTARAAVADDVAFERAWQDGRALTVELALELALKDRPGRE